MITMWTVIFSAAVGESNELVCGEIRTENRFS